MNVKRVLMWFMALVFVVGFAAVGFTEEIQIQEFKPDIQIPGTEIKAGFLSVYQDKYTAGKVGFKIKNDFYYLEKEHPSKLDELDVFGDNIYAVFNDLLIIGTWGSPTGHGRWLFLFRFNKDNIKFVDALHATEYDFAEIYDTTVKKLHKNNKLNILQVKNGDKAIIRMQMLKVYFSLFVKVAGDGFKIDLNPDLYEPLFREVENKSKIKKADIYKYLVYGFLTKTLNKKDVTDFLKKKKDSMELMEILENIDKFNEALHPKEQIILKKIEQGGK